MITLYRVTHREDLLDQYPCPEDGLRVIYSTEKDPWGKYLNEFCLWFDENIQPNTEFVGLEHYRRTFWKITPDSLENYLGKLQVGHCYTYESRYMPGRYNVPYLRLLGLSKFQDQLENYFSSKRMKKEKELLLHSNLINWRSMFIMHLEDFKRLRRFLIDIKNYLFEVNKITSEETLEKSIEDITPFPEPWHMQKHRTFAYIFEYLTDLWIRSNLKGWTLYDGGFVR